MDSRNEDCCVITKSMWKNSLDCSRGVNKGFSAVVRDWSRDDLCCCAIVILSCVQPEVPSIFFATWCLACTAAPAGATLCTPFTALADCSIFSCNSIARGVRSPAAPERQDMDYFEGRNGMSMGQFYKI